MIPKSTTASTAATATATAAAATTGGEKKRGILFGGIENKQIRATLKYLTDRAVSLEPIAEQTERMNQVNKVIDAYNSMGVKEWGSSTDYLENNELVITARDIILRRPFGAEDTGSYALLDSEGNIE